MCSECVSVQSPVDHGWGWRDDVHFPVLYDHAEEQRKVSLASVARGS